MRCNILLDIEQRTEVVFLMNTSRGGLRLVHKSMISINEYLCHSNTFLV